MRNQTILAVAAEVLVQHPVRLHQHGHARLDHVAERRIPVARAEARGAQRLAHLRADDARLVAATRAMRDANARAEICAALGHGCVISSEAHGSTAYGAGVSFRLRSSESTVCSGAIRRPNTSAP